MISETRSPTRFVPMRRSARHGVPFPPIVEASTLGMRRYWWISPESRSRLLPELNWLVSWGAMNYPLPIIRRLLLLRHDWARK